MSTLFSLPRVTPVDSSGQPYAAAKLYFYGAGTLVHQLVYTDEALTVAHAQPVVADANGRFAAIYLNTGAASDYRIQLKTSSDVLIYDQDNIPKSELTQEVIAEYFYPITAEEQSAGVTPTDYQYEPCNLLRYGANASPGVTDMLVAFNTWISVANAYSLSAGAINTGPKMVLPAGLYFVSNTINMDIPDGTTVEFIGTIVTNVSGTTRAMYIGAANKNTWCLDIRGLKIYRSSFAGSSGSAGVEMYNLVNCTIDIRQVWNFTVGVVCHGTGSYGFSYNNLYFGTITDNQVNLQCWVTSNGWCNENNFYGGSFGHTTAFDAAYPTLYTINIEVIHDATHNLNNNRFYGPSLEDNIAVYRRAAIINGVNNWLILPRLENPGAITTYGIYFTANAVSCGILGLGQERAHSNVYDSGSLTQYETYEGRFMRSATPAAAGKSVLTLQSPSTSAARNLSILNSGGTETFYIDGDGIVHGHRYHMAGYSGRDYANDSAAAAGGVALGEIYHTSGTLKVRIV